MGLANKASKAVKLMVMRRVWGAIISFSIMAYLSRELNVKDFGIVAISNVLIQFINLIATSGISEYIIFYNKEDKIRVQNAAFWLNLLLTVIVTIFIIIAAPFWAKYYEDDKISTIIYFLVIAFVFNMIASIPIGIFRKELNYKLMTLIQSIFGTLNNIGQLLFAFSGFGVYSLVVPNAILAPISAGILIYKSGFNPKKELGVQYWKSIIHYTKYVVGQRILGKVVNEGDTFIVGKSMGLQSLGVYNMAFQFSNLFVGYILPILSNVFLPLYSINNSDLKIVKQKFFKTTEYLAIIMFPILTLLLINADILVKTIYGEKWIQSILYIQIFMFYIMLYAISSGASGVYNAIGKPKIGLTFVLFYSPLFFTILFFVAYQFKSLIYIVLIITIMRILGSLIHFYIVSRLLSFSFYSFLYKLIPFIITSMFFGLTKITFFKEIEIIDNLIISIIYVLIILFVYFKFYNQSTKELIKLLQL